MKTNIEARPMYSGFTQLTWSWFFTTIISLSAFFGTHSIFFKPTIAVMTTLTVLAAAFLFCLRIAWQEKTSMVWQYIASQVVFIGAVYAGVASLFVSGWFVVATIIYGGATFILMFFNLSGGQEANPRGLRAHTYHISSNRIHGFIFSFHGRYIKPTTCRKSL